MAKFFNRFGAGRALVLVAFLLLPLVGALGYDRDWLEHPPLVEINGAARVYAIGDVHGAFAELANSLRALGLARLDPQDRFRFNWVGGDAVLIFTGDYVNRGRFSRQVIEAIMDLEKKANAAGGLVISVLGNHEIRLLRGEIEVKAGDAKESDSKRFMYQQTLDSFKGAEMTFAEVISENSIYGKWLRNLPLFAVVNGFMFAHGGLPEKPHCKEELAEKFIKRVNDGDFSKGILSSKTQVIWNRHWWEDYDFVSKSLNALGIRGVVFGHTVGAFGKKGLIQARDNRLVSIDIGMTPSYGHSKGGGLEILTQNNKLVFTAKYPGQKIEKLFEVELVPKAQR